MATLNLLAIGLIVSLAVAVAATTYWYAKKDIVHPVVLLNGTVSYFILVPAVYLGATRNFSLEFPFAYENPEWTFVQTLALCLAVYLCIVVTFMRVPVRRTTSPPEETGWRATPASLLALGILGFGAGLLLFGYYVFVNGGPIRLLLVTPRTAFQTVPETARYRIFGLTGIFGGLFTALMAVRPGVETRSLSRSRAVLLLSMVSVALAVAVSTRARMVVLIPLAALLVYFYTAEYIQPSHLVGLGGAVVALGAGFTFVEHLVLGSAGLYQLFTGFVHVSRFRVLMAVVASVPETHPYQWGATYLNALLIDVPGAPLPYGEQLDLIVAGEDTPGVTRSAMLVGEWFLNFGLVGALAGSVLYGAALRYVYEALAGARDVFIRGFYPIVIVGLVLLFPSNVAWGLKAILLRCIVPVVLASLAAHLWESHGRVRFARWMKP